MLQGNQIHECFLIRLLLILWANNVHIQSVNSLTLCFIKALIKLNFDLSQNQCHSRMSS